MVFLWFSYDFLMVFLWFSYDFPKPMPGAFRSAAADPGAAAAAGLLATAARGEVQRPAAAEGGEGDEAPCGQAVTSKQTHRGKKWWRERGEKF